jgi:predicted transcriptional regulator
MYNLIIVFHDYLAVSLLYDSHRGDRSSGHRETSTYRTTMKGISMTIMYFEEACDVSRRESARLFQSRIQGVGRAL